MTSAGPAPLVEPSAIPCGIPSIHAEHAARAAALDRALAALAQGDAAALALALSEFRDATAAHFRSEEDLMRACAFPQAAPHAAAHAQYLDFLDRCSAELARSGLSATVRGWIGDGVPQWVAVHLASDRAFAHHVERPVAAVAAETPWRAALPEALRARQAPGATPGDPSDVGQLATAATEVAALSGSLDGGDIAGARRVLEALGAGLRELFAAEERLMVESAFASAADHGIIAHAHDLILADLAALGRAIDQGEPGAAERWAKLRTAMWFGTHRTLADSALHAYLAARP
jgi:hemerythrin-like metal-binding protein